MTDAESKLSISGGNCAISGGKATPAWGDPAIWWELATPSAFTFAAAEWFSVGFHKRRVEQVFRLG